MVTALLLFPLLGGDPQPESFAQTLDVYRERKAWQSAAMMLRRLASYDETERPIARFLLANDMAELGLEDLAVQELGGLLDSPTLGGAAFLALARLRSDRQDAEALRSLAGHATWDQLHDEDFAEALLRVARACMQTGHHPEAREWLERISPRSSYFLFSRYLLAQTEYALGRSRRALDAAELIFRTPVREPVNRWLQERTAVFVGDMLTEIGLYEDAAAVLAWPSDESPFRARAEQDAALARHLGAIEEEKESKGNPVDPMLERTEADVAAAVASQPSLEARARELESVWPSAALRRTRRHWAATAALQAFGEDGRFPWRRPFQILWRSLPPVLFYELLRRAPAEPEAPAPSDEARFFFTPRREVSRLLVAIAIASGPGGAETCSDLAARSLAARAAARASGIDRAPSEAEIQSIADGCAGDDPRDLLPTLRSKLSSAIAAEAAERRLDLRGRRYLVAEAEIAVRRRHEAEINAARGEKP